VTDSESRIGRDFGVSKLVAWQRPELFHSKASLAGWRLSWGPDTSLPTVAWSRTPADVELALALCHPDGRIREASLGHAEKRPALLALAQSTDRPSVRAPNLRRDGTTAQRAWRAYERRPTPAVRGLYGCCTEPEP
jgi:hypothetical protein